MGGCNESKVVPFAGKSSSKNKNKSFSFWKFMKNRRNMTRVAPLLPVDQRISEVLSGTVVEPSKSPVLITNRPRSGHNLSSPSPTFSEESLSRYMITEETADGDELLELQAAERPHTPDFCIVGTPLFAKKINNKKELHQRQESQEILRQLRDVGIVARPESRTGGLSYEFFVHEEFGLLKKPPARLQKLKKAKKVRDAQGDAHLKQEMENRMQMAEERRENALNMVRKRSILRVVKEVQMARDISASQKEDQKTLIPEQPWQD